MLDQDLIQQLKHVFSSLEGTITLAVAQSTHEDQKDLLALLKSVEETSLKIEVTMTAESSSFPQFKVLYNNNETGISFKGIPTGHEFSSLVLAILNSDRKGKFPDEMIIQRIKNIKGPIRLKTYISLTCENCPNVIQNLNLMALLHKDFKHEMIDGGYVQEDIQKLGIQGVPSVVSEGKLIHSGRIEFIDLIDKLEKHFGVNEQEVTSSTHLGLFDVVIIGGGPAGASSAIYSARKGLKTAIIAEKIGGQVRETKGIENLVSVLYTEGPELASKLNEHMVQYPIKIFEHRRVETIEQDSIKKIKLQSGEVIDAKSVIITTGAKWRELGIPGEKDYIGRGVAFCPHCDGPYYKGKKIAVVGGGNSGVEAAIDLANIVKEVVLIEYAAELKADKVLVEKLKSLNNVSIITNARTEEIVGDGKKVEGLRFENRETKEKIRIDLEGVFIQIGLLPNSQFVKGLVETTPFGEIIVDQKCRTSQKGIYAAGDVTTVPYKQIIIAMGEGAKAALSAFEDLMFQHT